MVANLQNCPAKISEWRTYLLDVDNYEKLNKKIVHMISDEKENPEKIKSACRLLSAVLSHEKKFIKII